MKEMSYQHNMFNIEPSENKMSSISEDQVFFLTNQSNLLEILSSGYIKPATWISKYYADLSRFCPSGIPLLLTPPSETLITDSIDQSSNIYPVLVQLSLDGISGKAAQIDQEGNIVMVELPTKLEGICLVLQYAIPVANIRIAHFRSYTELKEFKLREFVNVPHPGFDYQPSGNLFNNFIFSFSKLPDTLRQLNTTLNVVEPSFPKVMDSIAGGYLLACKLAEKTSVIPLDGIAELFNLVSASIFMPDSKQTHMPVEFKWIHWIAAAFPEGSPSHETLANLYAKAEKEGIGKAQRIEWLLAAIAFGKLARLDKNSFSPDRTVADIFNDFNKALTTVETDDVENTKQVYQSLLRSIEAVREGMDDLGVFLQTYPPAMFPASNALMMFILGTAPEQMLTWSNTNPEIPPYILLMATIFAGLLCGRTLLPLEQRPPAQVIDFVDNLLARFLNQNTNGINLPPPKHQLVFKRQETQDGFNDTLKYSENILLTRTQLRVPESDLQIPGTAKSIKTPLPGPKEERPLDTKTSIRGKQIPTSKKLQPTIPGIINRLLSDELNPENLFLHKLAIGICEVLRWPDLISTALPLEHRDFILEYRKGRMEFRVSGFTKPEYRLNQLDEFKKRLASLSDTDIEQKLTPILDRLMTDSGLVQRSSSDNPESTLPPELESYSE